MNCDVTRHYDLLIEEGNDSVLDPPALQEYMNRWDGPRFIDYLRTHLAGTPDASVLEVGVGTGRLALRVCKFCSDFTGIDLSPKSIATAREHLHSCTGTELICGDFLSHDFERHFDAIYSSLTFMHIADKALAIQKTADLLHPRGLFLLSMDKAQVATLDYGTRKIKIYSDDPNQIETLMQTAGFAIAARWETDAATAIAARKLPQVIHIIGASGSGTSTLARALEARHGYKWMDTDGYFWAPTDPPYQYSLPHAERLELMHAVMQKYPKCVISGSLCGWGDVFIPDFDLVIWLQAPTELRLERLRQRESLEFSARILPGGDMYENHQKFLAWAAAYDTGALDMRSCALHAQWVRGLGCPVRILDSSKPVDELVNAALEPMEMT